MRVPAAAAAAVAACSPLSRPALYPALPPPDPRLRQLLLHVRMGVLLVFGSCWRQPGALKRQLSCFPVHACAASSRHMPTPPHPHPTGPPTLQLRIPVPPEGHAGGPQAHGRVLQRLHAEPRPVCGQGGAGCGHRQRHPGHLCRQSRWVGRRSMGGGELKLAGCSVRSQPWLLTMQELTLLALPLAVLCLCASRKHVARSPLLFRLLRAPALVCMQRWCAPFSCCRPAAHPALGLLPGPTQARARCMRWRPPTWPSLPSGWWRRRVWMAWWR